MLLLNAVFSLRKHNVICNYGNIERNVNIKQGKLLVVYNSRIVRDVVA